MSQVGRRQFLTAAGALLDAPPAAAILGANLPTPATNMIVRSAENQADAFGLDAAREPHGFAGVAMRISNCRKTVPSALA